jgi:regulator of replication initiation timing
MNYKRYTLAFIITSAIFITAILISNKLNESKLEQVRAIEDKMSIDILSLETQFDLLQELSCEQIGENTVLSTELSSLARKLSHMEESRSVDDPEVVRLKRRYSLLQIKDLLLMRKVAAKCDIAPTVILYFYSNAGDCDDCKRQGYVLTKLGDDFDALRVYAFDANLDLSALKTLVNINKVGDALPALVIDGKTHTGFISLDEMRGLLPELDVEVIKKEDAIHL